MWTLYGTLLGCLGAAAKWSFTGKLEPHNGFPMYDSLSFRRALVLISEMPLGKPTPNLTRAKPSPAHRHWPCQLDARVAICSAEQHAWAERTDMLPSCLQAPLLRRSVHHHGTTCLPACAA